MPLVWWYDEWSTWPTETIQSTSYLSNNTSGWYAWPVTTGADDDTPTVRADAPGTRPRDHGHPCGRAPRRGAGEAHGRAAHDVARTQTQTPLAVASRWREGHFARPRHTGSSKPGQPRFLLSPGWPGRKPSVHQEILDLPADRFRADDLGVLITLSTKEQSAMPSSTEIIETALRNVRTAIVEAAIELQNDIGPECEAADTAWEQLAAALDSITDSNMHPYKSRSDMADGTDRLNNAVEAHGKEQAWNKTTQWAEAPQGFVRDPGTGKLYRKDEVFSLDPVTKARIARGL